IWLNVEGSMIPLNAAVGLAWKNGLADVPHGVPSASEGLFIGLNTLWFSPLKKQATPGSTPFGSAALPLRNPECEKSPFNSSGIHTGKPPRVSDELSRCP